MRLASRNPAPDLASQDTDFATGANLAQGLRSNERDTTSVDAL